VSICFCKISDHTVKIAMLILTSSSEWNCTLSHSNKHNPVQDCTMRRIKPLTQSSMGLHDAKPQLPAVLSKGNWINATMTKSYDPFSQRRDFNKTQKARHRQHNFSFQPIRHLNLFAISTNYNLVVGLCIRHLTIVTSWKKGHYDFWGNWDHFMLK